jgi:hypothetical protein
VSFQIGPHKLKNFRHLHIIFEIKNSHRANVVFEVEVAAKRSVFASICFVIAVILLSLGPHLVSVRLGFRMYYFLACVLIYLLLSYPQVFKQYAYYGAIIVAMITCEKTKVGKKVTIEFNDKFWREHLKQVEMFHVHQTLIVVLTTLIGAMALGGFLQEVLAPEFYSARSAVRDGSGPKTSQYILFYVLGTILMIQSVNAPVTNLILLSAAFLVFPILIRKV